MAEHGYAIKCGLHYNNELAHLMDLDDVKLLDGTDDHLRTLLRIVDLFSSHIRMEFGLDRYRMSIIRYSHHDHGDRRLLQIPRNSGKEPMLQLMI